MAGGSGTTFTFYHYDPSLAGAIVVASLFGILTAVHTWQVARYRTLYFIPFVLGALFECVGYLGRVWSATQTPDWTLQPYIVQSLLILVAPALLAASVYMVLGRLVVLIEGGEKACPVPTRWLTKIFVAGDVLSFLIQGAGGGLLAKANSASSFALGSQVIMAGLGVQLLFFSLFVAAAGTFHVRLRRRSAPVTATSASGRPVPWQSVLFVLYAVSALILVRSVFRLVEYGQSTGGSGGALQEAEGWLYGFDAALMLAAVTIVAAVYPGRVMGPSPKKSARGAGGGRKGRGRGNSAVSGRNDLLEDGSYTGGNTTGTDEELEMRRGDWTRVNSAERGQHVVVRTEGK